ncbi:hypothetical protein [Trichothermofontia sp.]
MTISQQLASAIASPIYPHRIISLDLTGDRSLRSVRLIIEPVLQPIFL